MLPAIALLLTKNALKNCFWGALNVLLFLKKNSRPEQKTTQDI